MTIKEWDIEQASERILKCEFPSLRFRREARRLIKSQMEEYIRSVRETEMVSDLLVGTRQEDSSGYVWNVLARDFDIDSEQPSGTKRLGECMGRLRRSLSSVLDLRVSNVQPSQVEGLYQRCEELNIDLVSIHVDVRLG